jgi:hypothetical protein
MARAFIGDLVCEVTIDKDLGDSWAVNVIPPPPTRKGMPSLAPMVVKLQGEDKERIMKGALEILQKAGRIDRYEI